MRKKLKKTAVIFFGVMIAFTILSRAAYNITTPKVVLGKPESMEMGPEIIGNGVVEAEEIVPVSTVEQKVVRKVHVLAGQKVKAGDVLYELDLEKLQEEIGEKERELKSLELQMESAKSMQSVARQTKEMMQSQAISDYERIEQTANQEIAKAEAEWNRVWEEYSQFQKNPELYPNRTEQEFLQKIEETEQAYESSITAKEESLYQAQKAIDSASLPEAKDTTTEQSELVKAGIERELTKLKELQMKEGKILSPIEGVISAVNVQVGGVTSGTADILIGDISAGMVLKAQFSEEEKEYVQTGASITVISDEMTENEKKAAGDLKIAAVQQNAEMGNVLEASIRILPNTLPVGTSVGVQVETSKKQYSECVPLEALHLVYEPKEEEMASFQRVVMKVKEQESRRVLEERLQMAFGFGKILDHTWMKMVLELYLSVIPILLSVFLLGNVWRYQKESKHKPEKCVWLFLFVGIGVVVGFLTIRNISIPLDMIPDRWSDFEFWTDYVVCQRENLERWVQMRKTAFDMRIVRAVRKIVCYNTVAIVLFCGNLCYSEKQRKQERI